MDSLGLRVYFGLRLQDLGLRFEGLTPADVGFQVTGSGLRDP